ncbi:hypothetical protein [Lacinutrix salivirga]
MKKVLILLVTIVAFISCKNDAKTDSPENIKNIDGPEKTSKQNDGLTLLVGDFVYYADAAVLQTHKEVYGVVLDEKMQTLSTMAKEFKKEPTDMVKVQVRGKIIPKDSLEEGWPYKVEIKEIMSVKPIDAKKNEVIKIGN